jgi:hypothetical protein
MIISRIAAAALVLGVGCVFGIGLALRNRHPTPERAPSACRLSVPHSSLDPMVFPRKDGSEALDAVIMSNADASAIRRVISEQGGFSIPHGTACSVVETGPMYAEVVVTDGPFVGKTVWAPAIHTQGN